MKALSIYPLLAALSLVGLLAGCGRHSAGEHEHAHAAAPGHSGEVPAGASFKAGKGILLTDETRKILGVAIVDVTEEELPRHFRFGVRAFGEKHRVTPDANDHTGCEQLGAGFLSSSEAALIPLRSAAKLSNATGVEWPGKVTLIGATGVAGEAEVIIGMNGGGERPKSGEFLSASVTLPSSGKVAVVPAGALLRTVDGAFVYTVNGSAYFRTAVKTGAETDGKVEITDGLLAGDQVVTTPVAILWAIELRATNAGDACTH